MKEERYFYTPDVASGVLPDEEAQHAVRVLRLTAGSEVMLMDGQGTFFRAHLTDVGKRACAFDVDETLPQERAWAGRLHLGIAPTKNADRMEWMVEKAVEIGVDEITFLDCAFSERHHLNLQRLERIVVSAMKQSRKAWKTVLNPLVRFDDFLKKTTEQQRFICHCYEGERPMLSRQLAKGTSALTLIGPEGDFSLQEVKAAEAAGFEGVSLDRSRLRTETAGLVAVMMMHQANEL